MTVENILDLCIDYNEFTLAIYSYGESERIYKTESFCLGEYPLPEIPKEILKHNVCAMEFRNNYLKLILEMSANK